MSVAVHSGRLRATNALLMLEPEHPSQNGLTALHVAAHYDNQKVALLLLEKGASPHATAKVRTAGRSETPRHVGVGLKHAAWQAPARPGEALGTGRRRAERHTEGTGLTVSVLSTVSEAPRPVLGRAV